MSRQLLTILSYAIAGVHIGVSVNYLDEFTAIGVGYVTSKMLIAYSVGDLLLVACLIAHLFFRDARLLVSILCLILSLPFLGYLLALGLVQSVIRGPWAASAQYARPDPLAALDLALIFGFAATSALSRRSRRPGRSGKPVGEPV